MTSTTLRPPLVRPRAVVIAGVAAALADHLRWPVGVVRIAFACLVFAGGTGALFYLWLWAFVPVEPETAGTGVLPTTRRVPAAAILLGVAGVLDLVLVAAISGSNDDFVNFCLVAAMIAGGASVAWSLTLDRGDPARTTRYSYVVRIGSVASLLLGGIAVLLSRPTALNAVLALVAIVLGGAVLVTPRLVSLWSDLMTERSARVRQEQRAEIAAHLHDSVLQTLALIQNRAGASSEVARIARAQERELRDWLFADDQPPAGDLATELRTVAGAIELDYAVRIDVVSAGAPIEPADPSLVGAAREAMLNAARHAGGEVSVYLETSAGAIDVFIRDRGPGLDLSALPDDRLGIRESIIGRMTRAGGTATVRPGVASGTEVHLHLEAARD